MKTILQSSGENSFLRDALRDLIVVVVGILAALWLESWWQDRLDRQEERRVLSNLRAEFVVNEEDVADVNESVRRAIESVDQFTAQIDGFGADEFAVDLSTAVWLGGIRFFDPRHGQLTSVIHSGKLGLIANDELRALIADWPALAEDMDLERTMFVEITAHGMGAYFRRFAGRPGSRFESDVDALMNNRHFYNDLRFYRVILARMEVETETISQTTNRIIELIDHELGDE